MYLNRTRLFIPFRLFFFHRSDCYVCKFVVSKATHQTSNSMTPTALALSLAVFVLVTLPVAFPLTTAGDECVNGAFPPTDASRAVGWHVVHLDDAPEARWTSLIKEKRKEIAALITHIKTVRTHVGLHLGLCSRSTWS